MSKVLIFEGAGWDCAEHNGVGNCRIRTKIKNKNGRIIYLELSKSERNKYNNQPYEYTAIISHCFYYDNEIDRNKNYSEEISKHEYVTKFPYTKDSILQFVNINLNCDFTELQVVNDGSIRTHKIEKELC